MSLSQYAKDQLRKLNRYARRRYAQDHFRDAMRSYNYFIYAGNSWNVKPRNIGLMERFTRRLIDAITNAVRHDIPEDELFRLFDALGNAINRYKHYKKHNM